MGIAVVVAVAIRVIGGHAFPDYDATFALIWGRDLAHGHGPNYDIPFRPAGHPLLMLVTTVSSPLGREGAADILRWVALLGAGFFVASLFRLGQVLFGTATGVVAAVVLATRAPTWGFSLLAYMDAVAAAFVLYAVALEVARPRRGTSVLALLALAGLLRPEVWLLAAAYWLWCAWGAPGRALRLIPWAALGPLIWIVFDLITTHEFLGSIFASSDAPGVTSTAGSGVSETPRALARFIGGYLRAPEAVAAAAGLLFVIWRRDRRLILPLAAGALNVAAFVLVAARNGPLEQRYLLVAAAVAVLLTAYAIARAPRAVAGLLVLACLAYLPVDAKRIGDLRDQVHHANAADNQLRDAIRAEAGCLAAGGVQLPDPRLRPFIAYWTPIDEARVGTDPAPTTLVPVGPIAREIASKSLPADPDLRVTRMEWRLDGSCARQ